MFHRSGSEPFKGSFCVNIKFITYRFISNSKKQNLMKSKISDGFHVFSKSENFREYSTLCRVECRVAAARLRPDGRQTGKLEWAGGTCRRRFSGGAGVPPARCHGAGGDGGRHLARGAAKPGRSKATERSGRGRGGPSHPRGKPCQRATRMPTRAAGLCRAAVFLGVRALRPHQLNCPTAGGQHARPAISPQCAIGVVAVGPVPDSCTMASMSRAAA